MHRSTKTGLVGLAVLVVVLVIILFLNMEGIQPKENESCLDGEKQITCQLEQRKNTTYRLYGTKTTYEEALKNTHQDVPPVDLKAHNCTVRAFYLFSRHATRYPNGGKIEEMIDTLPYLKEKIINASVLGKGSVCMRDIQKLKEWTLSMTKEDDNKISLTGQVEMEQIAKRLKILFPSVLGQEYSPDRFIFEYTAKERTKSSAQAFARGLFDESQYKKIDFDNKTNDEVLSFHKSCKARQKQCKLDGSYDISEIAKVEKGALMKATIERIGDTLGFPLTKDEVDTMYLGCFSEYAIGGNDIWCHFFSTADLRVLEFESDIDDYYKDGYGNKINYEQACPVAKYMLNFFRTALDNTTAPPSAVLHFSHSGAIKKVLSMFGLHRDNLPLTADAFCRQTARRWRSSIASPFAANLALALLRCGGATKVYALLNERPVALAGCTEGPLCGLDEFRAIYGPKADRCDIDKVCCTCCSRGEEEE